MPDDTHRCVLQVTDKVLCYEGWNTGRLCVILAIYTTSGNDSFVVLMSVGVLLRQAEGVILEAVCLYCCGWQPSPGPCRGAASADHCLPYLHAKEHHKDDLF